MGYHGCPMCHDDIYSLHDIGMGKTIYGRHRRFLPLDHPMRLDTDHWFGVPKMERAPVWPTSDDWLNRWAEVERGDILIGQSGMKRLAIWNELPYWKVGTEAPLPPSWCACMHNTGISRK